VSAWLPPPHVIAQLGLIFVVFNCLVMSAAFMVWLERKVCAYIQDRPGPNRVGFEGALQPFADVLKLLFKEQLRPKAAEAKFLVQRDARLIRQGNAAEQRMAAARRQTFE